MKTQTFFAVTLAALVLASAGCKTSPSEIFKPSFATVEIPYRGETVTVKITASRFNKHSQIGVRHLQAGDWQLAIDELSQALAESPDDPATLFALGVASEQLGHLDKALEYYKKANAAKSGGEADPQYIAAIKRIQSKQTGGK